MKNKIIIFILFLMLSGCNTSMVTFIVQVPINTDQVTIVGNMPQLGNWNPAEIPLKKIDSTKYSIALKLPNNTKIGYKITRGSWITEALSHDGRIPNNYNIMIRKDTIITHSIAKWKDEIIPESSITGNVVYHHKFYSPQLNNFRDIIVWLPPSYSENHEKMYPVLYLHDGQNVFDPSTSYIGIDWQLDEIATKLIEENKINEIIMVGIYCTQDRTTEYSPIHNGEKYSQFLIETVKPYIDNTYRTLKDANNTAVMGSSMGGIISFHLAWEYPNIFSMAGCLSPAFIVDNEEIIDRVKRTRKDKLIKLVITNGTVGLEAELQPAITALVNELKEKQFKNLIYNIFEDAEHNESAWAKQVEIPLMYFFGN